MHQLLLSIVDDIHSNNLDQLKQKYDLYDEYIATMTLETFYLLKTIKPQVTENFENIPGLYYIRNFLDTSEMNFLNNKIKSIKFEPITTALNSRRVAHFGYYYSYDRSGLKVAPPLPEYMRTLITQSKLKQIILPQEFDQLIINEYKPGQRISAHTDHTKQFGPIIACISLGQSVPITFTLGSIKKTFNIESGSLYIMTKESRYKWLHSLINPGPNIRYSLTFRNVSI